MSRVYNVLTGAARPAAPVTPEAPDDGVWANEEAPFVEIGGPSGPVFSAAPAATTPPPPKPEPKAEAPRSYPRLAPAPAATAYLSVRFHDAIVPGAPRPGGGGPDSSLVAFHHPDHAISGEYRALRDEIRRQLPDGTPRVVLLAAAAPEAGTTTVLLNLAVTLAGDAGGRVLVLDANATRAAVAARLGLRPTPGLCEVLGHHVPLAWAVQPSAIQNLQVLTAGDAGEVKPATLARDLPRLLAQLRQWYDWVLVDGGVWGKMPERDAACPAADAVYLVTREADADRPEFADVRGRVKELGGVLRGYVATRV